MCYKDIGQSFYNLLIVQGLIVNILGKEGGGGGRGIYVASLLT